MTRPLPETHRLRTRLAAALAFAALAVFGLALALVFFQHRARSQAEARLRLLDLARLAALQVEAGAAEGSPALAESLQQVLDAGTGLRQAAVLQVQDGELALLASADRSPAGAPENPFLQASPALVTRLSSLEAPFVEDALRSSPTGPWLAAYAPLDPGLEAGPLLLALSLDASPLIAGERSFLSLLLLSLGGLVLFMAVLGWYAGIRLARPLYVLIQGIEQLVRGDLTYRLPAVGVGELPNVSRALNRMADRLQEFVVGEQEKTLRSEHRRAHLSATLQAVQAAAQAAGSGRERPQVEQEILEQAAAVFRLSCAALYRLEENGEASLSAWACAPGIQTVQPPERIQPGEGLVGRCLLAGQEPAQGSAAGLLEIQDGQGSAPSGPLSRAEAALPLQAGGRLLGALWLSGAGPEALNEEKIANLQALASILALLLHPSELPVSRTQAAPLSGLQMPAGQGLAGRLAARAPLVYRAASPRPFSPPVNGSAPPGEAGAPASLSLPIQLRGRTIGTLDLVKAAGSGEWSGAEQELVNKLLEQLTAALESARLYEETQRRAEQERLAGEIIGRIRAGNNPDAILRTATEELRRALKATRAQVHLHPAPPEKGPVSGDGFDTESDVPRGEK